MTWIKKKVDTKIRTLRLNSILCRRCFTAIKFKRRSKGESTSKKFGLEINLEKSSIRIFNMKEQTDELIGIQALQSIKYLGTEIDNTRNYFKTQRDKIIQNARNMVKFTHCVIEKSCNKLLIG